MHRVIERQREREGERHREGYRGIERDIYNNDLNGIF